MSDSNAMDLGRLMEKVANLSEETKEQASALKDMGTFLTAKFDEQTTTLRERSDSGFNDLREQMHKMGSGFVSRSEWLERMEQWRIDFTGAANSLRTELSIVRGIADSASRSIHTFETEKRQQEKDRAPSINATWTVVAMVASQLLGAAILGVVGYFLLHK